MTRGGKRDNAGRPLGSSKISFMQKMTVGAACQRLHLKVKEEGDKKLILNAHKFVSEVWEEAQSIAIEDRAEWLNSEEYAEHQEVVEAMLQLDQGLVSMPSEKDENNYSLEEPEKPSRVVKVVPKTPQGDRKEILASISQDTGLKINQVDYCWKFFRNVEKRLKKQD